MGRCCVELVLGSGSSRGWAPIGLIEALQEAQIPIDVIAGSSVGAYVGSIYASGGLESLKDFVLRITLLGNRLDHHDDFALLLVAFHVAMRGGDLVQGKGAVDHGFEFAGLQAGTHELFTGA